MYKCFIGLVVFSMILCGIDVIASETGTDKVLLWPNGAPGQNGYQDQDKPSLLIYPASSANNTGAAVVVCPGGGYWKLAMDHEGHDVARWLNSFGVSAFILTYRHAPDYKHPIPLGDAQRAIRYVKAYAKQWGVDSDRVGILGFSAGGHLASSAVTHFDSGDSNAQELIEQYPSRPDFAVLVYPVISLVTDYTHQGSKRNLLGENPDEDLVKLMSSELQVTEDTPPVFMLHAGEDTAVPPENSILFYMACREKGVPAEMHIFAQGGHGFGLAPDDASLSTWPELCQKWMKKSGFLEN